MTRQKYSFWRVDLESDECGEPNRSRILDDSRNNQVTTTWPAGQGPNLICCHLSSLPDGLCPCLFPVASSLVYFFFHLCFPLNNKGKQAAPWR